VILALALAKIDSVVVPLDPTTGNRELEMVLEAAPLRALITRPAAARRASGGRFHRRTTASPRARAPPAGPPSKFVPEKPSPAAGDAADLQPVQAHAAREPGGQGAPPARGAVHGHGRR
jgi:acyl-CoA synthetase (AMP-forming)/AMP-acid ligase II